MIAHKNWAAALAVVAGLILPATGRAAFQVTFQDGGTSFTIADNDANDADSALGAIRTFGTTVPVSGALAGTDGITVGGFRVSFATTLGGSITGPGGLSIGSNAQNAVRRTSAAASDLVITVRADGTDIPNGSGVTTVLDSVTFSSSRLLDGVMTSTTLSDGGGSGTASNSVTPVPPLGGNSNPFQDSDLFLRTGNPSVFTQVTTIDLRTGGGTQLTRFSEFFSGTGQSSVPAPGAAVLALTALPFLGRLRRRLAA